MTKIVQSKELTAFYNAYNDWLEAGAPTENEYNFRRYYGLCDSLELFSLVKKFSSLVTDIITKEMSSQFGQANLSCKFPFGSYEYHDRFLDDTQHLDPNRIAWVKSHLTEEVDKEFTLQ